MLARCKVSISVGCQTSPGRARAKLTGRASENELVNWKVTGAFKTIGDGALTPCIGEIVELALRSHSSEAIGRFPGIAPGRTRIHCRNVYPKIRIRSQGELFSLFLCTIGQVLHAPPKRPSARLQKR